MSGNILNFNFTLICIGFAIYCYGEKNFELIVVSNRLVFKESALNVSAFLGKQFYDFNITTYRSIKNPLLKIEFQLKPLSDRNNEMRTLMNRTINICKFLSNPISDPFVYALYVTLLAKTNRTAVTCPLQPVNINT